jgi:hypothetical protein
MYKLRQPSEAQIEFAKSLGISIKGKSFRVLSAEIADKLELNSFDSIAKNYLKPGLKVKYIGENPLMPKSLEISTIGKNGYIYFKKTNKYCRPWNIELIK